MKRLLPALLAALCIPLAACNTFYAEAEQPRVCLTVPPQSFTIPGGGIVAPPGGFTGTWSGQVDLGIGNTLPDFLVNGSTDTHVLRFLDLEATLTSTGATNFDWLQNLSVTVSSGVVTQQLAFYDGGLTRGARTLTLEPVNPDNNLVTFLRNGNMVVFLTGTAAVPAGSPVPSTWTASITTCLYAKVRETLQEMTNK